MFIELSFREFSSLRRSETLRSSVAHGTFELPQSINISPLRGAHLIRRTLPSALRWPRFTRSASANARIKFSPNTFRTSFSV